MNPFFHFHLQLYRAIGASSPVEAAEWKAQPRVSLAHMNLSR